MTDNTQTISVANLNVAKVNGYDIDQDAWNNLNALASYGTNSNVIFNTLTAGISIPSGKTLTADGKTITDTELSKIAGLDQELKTTSTVAFNTLTAGISIPSGKALTADGKTITPTALSKISGLDQELKTTSDVAFNRSTTKNQPYIVVSYNNETMPLTDTYVTITGFTANKRYLWDIDVNNGIFTYTGTSNRVSVNIALYVRFVSNSSSSCTCIIRLTSDNSSEGATSDTLYIESNIQRTLFCITTVIDIDTDDAFKIQIKTLSSTVNNITVNGNVTII